VRGQAPPLGAEFQVNAYTTGRQSNPSVAPWNGGFIVVWARDPGNPGIFARTFDAQGAPTGPEFQINSGVPAPAQYPSVSADASGGFLVVWGDADLGWSFGQRFDSAGAKVGFQVESPGLLPRGARDASGNSVVLGRKAEGDIVGQRFDSSGSLLGSQFVVSAHTAFTVGKIITYLYAGASDVVMSPAGDFTIVWDVDQYQVVLGGRPQTFTPTNAGIFEQRFDRSGSPLGPVVAISTSGFFLSSTPSIAADKAGNFVVVWSSFGQDGDESAIMGQRLDSSGARVGNEFRVNTYTTGDQTLPSIAFDETGDFVVVWDSAGQDGSSNGIFGARFDRKGNRVGGEFPINTFTTGAQSRPRIANDGRGFVVVWQSFDQDGDDLGVFGRRQNLHAETLAVDSAAPSGTSSDTNGVLEPGETVLVEPRWRNVSDGPLTVTAGTAILPCAPGTACVTPVNTSATYGLIASDAVGSCNKVSPDACYRVSASGPRPATHWDGGFAETLAGGGGRLWTMHVGDSFSDVPRTQPFYKKIETLLHNGITTGCTATTYCPGSTVSRDAMAIFIARALAGGGEFVPSTPVSGPPYDCSAGGHSNFTDIIPTDPFCKHVHYLANLNVLIGCNATQYCPSQTVTRDTMAAFIARALVAPGGGAAVPVTYTDPTSSRSYSCAAGSPLVHFSDVAVSNPFCKHIHYLWAKGIVDGCTAAAYCPGSPVARDAMAKFIANGFNLQLYGP
jgi:hypothetical protein